MKQLFTFFFITVNLVAFAQLPSNLKAYFPLNGNLNDSTGQSSPGINTGATACVDRWGISNKAYEFHGGGNNINLGPDLNFGITTISFWFKAIDFNNTDQVILSNLSNSSGSQQSQVEVYLNANSKIDVGLGHVYMIPTNYRKFTSNQALNLNNWNHIAVVIENNFGNVKLFINGVLDFDQAVTGLTYVKCTNSLRIGSRFNPVTENPFVGRLDDIMIYNKGLTNQEVKSVYSITNGIDKQNTTAILNAIDFNQRGQEIKLTAMASLSPSQFNVYDLSGKLVPVQKYLTQENQLTLVVNASPGIYLLRGNENTIPMVRKFVILE